MNARNPYIGPRSFTRKERAFFFGREREARDLLSLVISERLVLFYAQSGAGKTSLINTCLIPGLEENDRVVLPVGRVSGGLPAGVEAADNIFAFSLMLQLDQGGTAPAELAQLDLSSFLRNLVSADGQTYRYEPLADETASQSDSGDAPVCVLIIDQFEEILTAHPGRWQDRAAFFRQLNQAMQDDPKLSVLLALREDYVAALEPYAPLMADRMRARFYMERMGRKAALAAISKPAAQQGRPFAPGAAELLVDNLSLIRTSRSKEAKPGEHIEPVQLQVVCYQLWEKTAQADEITADQVKGAGDIDHALADFYELAIADALRTVKVSELELRHWFDHQLITPAGTRGTVFQGDETTAGMDNRVVRLLEDRFLLRAESRSGAAWYELVHDRFVGPIVQANRAWMDKQGPLLRDAQAWADSGKIDRTLLYTGEKLKNTLARIVDLSLLEPAVAQFLEESKGRQAWLDEKAAANRRVRIWFWVAVTVAVVTVLSSLLALRATYRAKEALTQLKQAVSQLNQAESLQTGMALNAKAEAAESKGSRLYAQLYSLHALDKMSQYKDSDEYMEAVIRAQANPIQLPAIAAHHDAEEGAVAFLPDGRTGVSASDDKTIGVWDAVTGTRLASLGWDTKDISGIIFSQNGRLFASASRNNNSISIWEVSTGKLIQTLEGHTAPIDRLSFSPDNQLVATGSADKTVGIWDVSTGKRLHSMKMKNSVYDVAFSPDSRLVSAVAIGDDISIWDVRTGQLFRTLAAPDSTSCAAFSPDGRTLATAGFEELDLWDLHNGNPLKRIKNNTGNGAISLSFSPDGFFVSIGYFRSKIGILNIQDGSLLKVMEGYSVINNNGIFSPDGQTLLVSGFLNTIALLEKPSERFHILKGHTDKVQGIRFSPDGMTFASAAKDKTVAVWDVNTGRRLQTTTLQEKGRISGLTDMPFSPNGQLVASTSWGSNNVTLWETSTGKALAVLEGHIDSIGNVLFSPDGKIVASGSWDNMLKIWEVKNGRNLTSIKDADVSLSKLSFSPDGRSIAMSRYAKGIYLFDISTGSRVKSIADREELAGRAVFSHDGKFIASALKDKAIGIWDTNTGQRIKTLKVSEDTRALSFSPDDHLLASSYRDKTIAIWDVKTGKRIRTLKDKNIATESILSFSPDSRTLAFTTDDNVIGLWDLEDNVNEWSGISLDEKGEYKIDLNTLPYKLEGLELKPVEQKAGSPDQPARWSKYHPFHWLPQAEAGDSNAMLQIGIIYDRNNDLARALQWYQRAIKAGSSQAKEQQSRLLHWLESEENWQTVPGPFRDSFCKAKAELELPEKVRMFCGKK